jgi:hypothetical protein
LFKLLTAIGKRWLFRDVLRAWAQANFFYLPEAHNGFRLPFFARRGIFGRLFSDYALFALGSSHSPGLPLIQKVASGFLLVTGVNFLIVGQAVIQIWQWSAVCFR